jgi:hypothetical protein
MCAYFQNEADAYRHCCSLGMKLFEPRSTHESNAIKAILDSKGLHFALWTLQNFDYFQ